MARKIWIAFFACAIVLSAPLGGVAAQSLPIVPQTGAAAWLARGSQSQAPSKLSSRLRALVASAELQTSSEQAQAQAVGLPTRGPGSLIRDAQGRLLIDVWLGATSAASLDSLRRAGAQVVDVSPRYGVVTALVAAADLAKVGQLADVSYAMEEYTPIHGSDPSQTEAPAAGPARVQAPSSTCPVGLALSEGDAQLKADQARTTFGINGSGVKVGILSDSYDADASANTHAADDVLSGDLPGAGNTCGFTTPVSVLSETVSTGTATDEGRGMLQVVHDLAPGATLGFASAHNGLFGFASNIQALSSWGADVMADDVTYFAEPMFQEGPVSVAIGNATAAGAVYLTSAANSNFIVGGHDVSSYEAPAYRPTSVPSFLAGQGEESCHNFNPSGAPNSAYAITLANGGSFLFDLQFAEPWYGVTTDLDVFLTDASNNVVAGSVFPDPGPHPVAPFQIVSFLNSGSSQTYHIEVCRYTLNGYDHATPRFKWVLLNPRGVTAVQYPTSNGGDIVGPTIFGHSASQYSLSVAAAPFNDSNNPETFSSRGPAAHYFGPVVGTTPAAAITPVILQQPDFAATDGGCTSFFGQSVGGNCFRFFGTSEAAPHVAAVAALLKQKYNLTHTLPINQGTARFLLQTTAQAMSGGSAGSTGAGLVDALAAVGKEVSYTHHLFLSLLR
jgi:hypothetical protein